MKLLQIHNNGLYLQNHKIWIHIIKPSATEFAIILLEGAFYTVISIVMGSNLFNIPYIT